MVAVLAEELNLNLDELCPCGSKRKFKNCCIDKTEIKDFYQYKKCRIYSERFAVDRLKKNVKEFKSFFDGERKNIKGYIYWAEHQIQGGTNGMAFPLPDGDNLILLQNIPPPTERAFAVAHELAHLLRKSADNYFNIEDVIRRYAMRPEIGNAINSMIEDHLADSILARYGFDLETEFEVNLRNQMTEIESSKYFLDEVDALTGFTNFKLCCDLIGPNFATWHECEKLLGLRFPELAVGVRELYSFIKRNENNIHTTERKMQLLGIISVTAARHPARSNLRTNSA
jgi:hypothetical protein